METVQIALHRHDPVSVPARFIGHLAVHREVDPEFLRTGRHGKRAEWTITHAPSGRMVYGFRTRAGAIEAAKAISCLADWSSDAPQETMTFDQREAVRLAIAAVSIIDCNRVRGNRC